MNTRETVTIRSPNETEEQCTKFIIEDIDTPFVLNDIAKEGQEYTFSSWMLSEEDLSVRIAGESLGVNTEWSRQYKTFFANDESLEIYFEKPGTYYFYHSQLEIGNIATDWTPAPEDLDESIENTNEKFKKYVTTVELNSAIEASAKEIDLSVNAVKTTVDGLKSRVETAEASLELKIDADTLISEINASADVITLSGNRFIVDSDNLKIDKDGTILAVNGIFQGDIVADSFVSENEYFKLEIDDGIVITGFSEYAEAGFVTKGFMGETHIFPTMITMESNGVYSSILFNGEEWRIDEDVYVTRLFSDGSCYVGGNLRFGDDQDTESVRAINTYWLDGSSHNIVQRSDDGLTSAFGWAGSSDYATVSVLRGRTCRYQNSSGTTTLSDERLKKDFVELDNWDSFYDSLEPCAFRMKNGNSGRYHMGFKAQQVEQALTDNGLTSKEFAGFIKMKYLPDEDDPEGNAIYSEAGINAGDEELGLIYTEFVAMNTYQIQRLKKELALMKEEMETLKQSMAV